MTAQDIKDLKKKISAANPDAAKEANEIYDLALLGCYTKDKIYPFLRHLPPTMVLDQGHYANTETDQKRNSTIEQEVKEIFEKAPQHK